MDETASDNAVNNTPFMPSPPPNFIQAMPRLRRDADSLLEMFFGSEPALISTHLTVTVAFYLMGDASRAGFSFAFWDGVHPEY